jgi:iron-sulfur cluster insertion protein
MQNANLTRAKTRAANGVVNSLIVTKPGLWKSTSIDLAERVGHALLPPDAFLEGACSEQALFKGYQTQPDKLLIEEEGNNELKLRVFVTGGGCSGLQYGFTFDEVANEDDTVMQKNGVSLLIDPMSYQYLVGAEIDYTEGLEGAQFVIKNPNATSTCGCGSSFTA